MTETKLTKIDPTKADVLDREDVGPQIGEWYWVKGGEHWGDDDYDEPGDRKWLGCVVHLGSNYVKLKGVRFESRVHIDEFDEECTFEPNPDAYIDGRIQGYQEKVQQLMGRVKEVTARLGVAPSPMLHAGSETKALARVGSGGADMDEYKAALILAKKETLPDLFKEIKNNNEAMAKWMTAKTIPLKAQAEGMKESIKHIDDRVFSVELYAGLTEQVTQIAEGAPAELGAKIHLLQRRHYMDEECLAQYQTGGMDFQGIGDFDRWLAEPEHRDRILPFPRCIVVFRIRRYTKHRDGVSISDFIRFTKMAEIDKMTFLYIRNGEQLFRMNTAIDFEDKLFPDLERSQLNGNKLWAKFFCERIDAIITDDDYQVRCQRYDRDKAEHAKKLRAYKKALKSPSAKLKAKEKGLKKPDDSCIDVPWCASWFSGDDPRDQFKPFNQDCVYYDDIAARIKEDIDKHNRIALILQGLLDRSPVLHPHPPWQIWTDEGFMAALELIYDQTRALVAGPKPDFEAYRDKLNESLKTGSVTVGQEVAWEEHEAEKYNKRMEERAYGGYHEMSRHRPPGNPGPGSLAVISQWSPRVRKATYAWNRDRQDWRHDDYGKPIRTTFTCEADRLLNVDAYTPGDFHQFFDDPRTRADYIEWAPFLLEAEEYHAGNRKAQKPVKGKPKKPPTWEGRRRYAQTKRRKELLGKAVRLTRKVETQGGDVYEVGSLWRIADGKADTFTIRGIDEQGKYLHGDDYRSVRGVYERSFEVDESIPPVESR